MFERQKTGSVVCPSCGKLVGVQEPKCPYCGRVRPGMFGLTKSLRDLGLDLNFTDLVLWTCGIVYVLMLIRDPSGMFQGGLMGLLAPTEESMRLFGAAGVESVVKEGRWWAVLSAGWLHGGILHIGFNLYGLRFLGPITAQLFGQGRFLIIYILASITGFVISTAVGLGILLLAPHGGCLLGAVVTVFGAGGIYLTLGASAGLTGLVGALLYYGQRAGSSALSQQAKSWVIFILIFGIFFKGIDNWAHMGGVLGGYLAARFLDPLKPERTDHLITGLLLFAVSVGAVIFSVLAGIL